MCKANLRPRDHLSLLWGSALIVVLAACASSPTEAPKACATSEECPATAPCCGVHGQGYACQKSDPFAYVCLCKTSDVCESGGCCKPLPFGSALTGCYDRREDAGQMCQ